MSKCNFICHLQEFTCKQSLHDKYTIYKEKGVLVLSTCFLDIYQQSDEDEEKVSKFKKRALSPDITDFKSPRVKKRKKKQQH
jgi:hypothetical protein